MGRTSSSEGAHSIQTVRGAGSSTAFSSTLPAPSVRRSASSMTMTCHRPTAGESWARRTRSRVSFTPMESRSVRMTWTSACVPIRLVWQPSQKPQPGAPPSARSGLVHWSAAAKARAAVDRPEPGGPVNSQACVIFEPWSSGLPSDTEVTSASASRAAAASCSCTRSCPTRSSHTVMGHRPSGGVVHGPRTAVRRRSPLVALHCGGRH